MKLLKKLFNKEPKRKVIKLRLLTPKEFEGLRNGTRLLNIHGFAAIKGKDPIDQDTRCGLMAWGWQMHPDDPDYERGWEVGK